MLGCPCGTFRRREGGGVPRAGALERGGCREDRRLVARASDDVQSHGQAVRRDPAGDARGRVADHVDRVGEGGNRDLAVCVAAVDLRRRLPQRESRGRHRRRKHEVVRLEERGEARLELVHPAQLGGVLASRYRRAVFQTPPRVPRDLVRVVAQQIAIARVQVGREQRPERVEWGLDGKVRVLHGAAQLFEHPGRGGRQPGDLCLGRRVSQIDRPADSEAFDAALRRRDVVLGRFPERAWVSRIVAGHDLQQDGRVLDGTAHGALLAELVGHGRPSHAAELGDPALRRLDPVDAAEAGRNSDGASAVAARRQRAQAGGQRRPGASAGAARRAARVPGVAAVAQAALGAPQQAELRRVRLAQDYRARRSHPLHDYGVGGRHPVFEDERAAGGANARRRLQVLHADGHAVQRAQVIAPHHGVLGVLRGGLSLVSGESQVRVELRIQTVDALEVEPDELDRGDLLFPNQVPELGRGLKRDVASCRHVGSPPGSELPPACLPGGPQAGRRRRTLYLVELLGVA